MDNPLDAVYAYAEQAYIRMQAGDILMRCMDLGSAEPMQELVEGLVLAGPQSMGALSEILSETGQRRAQIQDDLQRLYGELQNKLRQDGLRLQDLLPDALSLTRLSSPHFMVWLEKQNKRDQARNEARVQLLEETREMMKNLVNHLELIQEIEDYLRDWLWGLAHQSTQRSRPNLRASAPDWQM
jgi:hypothetical protein